MVKAFTVRVKQGLVVYAWRLVRFPILRQPPHCTIKRCFIEPSWREARREADHTGASRGSFYSPRSPRTKSHWCLTQPSALNDHDFLLLPDDRAMLHLWEGFLAVINDDMHRLWPDREIDMARRGGEWDKEGSFGRLLTAPQENSLHFENTNIWLSFVPWARALFKMRSA